MNKTAWLLLALALTAAPVSAQPGESPVQIEDCKAGEDGGLLIAKSDGSFAITFTNESQKVADLVRFQVELGQEQLFIRDAGKFSPGITIKHTYRQRGGNVVSSPLLKPAALRCQVADVHFVDGSSWTPDASSSAPSSTTAVLGDGYLGVIFKQQGDAIYAGLIVPASPAQKAGIRQGDQITTISSNTIATVSDANQLISSTPPGTQLQISVVRNGQTVTITATVGRRQAPEPSKSPK